MVHWKVQTEKEAQLWGVLDDVWNCNSLLGFGFEISQCIFRFELDDQEDYDAWECVRNCQEIEENDDTFDVPPSVEIVREVPNSEAEDDNVEEKRQTTKNPHKYALDFGQFFRHKNSIIFITF